MTHVVDSEGQAQRTHGDTSGFLHPLNTKQTLKQYQSARKDLVITEFVGFEMPPLQGLYQPPASVERQIIWDTAGNET